jgi:hypothetical protein
MYFEVESDTPCMIDAVGEMKPGVAVKLTDLDLKLFEVAHGVSLAKANFPPYVHITAVVED